MIPALRTDGEEEDGDDDELLLLLPLLDAPGYSSSNTTATPSAPEDEVDSSKTACDDRCSRRPAFTEPQA